MVVCIPPHWSDDDDDDGDDDDDDDDDTSENLGDLWLEKYVQRESTVKFWFLKLGEMADVWWYDDIFVNCNWVVTRWQKYSTHLHTNNT